MSPLHNLEKMIRHDIGREIPRTASFLFAPLDKHAFGVAFGLTGALSVAGVTILDLLLAEPWRGLGLLRQYFAGYSVSWPGALIGGAWGFAVAFCAGWLLAFVRNLTLALSLFLLRSRSELDGAWGIAVGLLLGMGLFTATIFLVLKGGLQVAAHLGLLGVGRIAGSVYNALARVE